MWNVSQPASFCVLEVISIANDSRRFVFRQTHTEFTHFTGGKIVRDTSLTLSFQNIFAFKQPLLFPK